MKYCNKCGDTKPLVEFNKDKGRSDGRNAYCRECTKEKGRAYEASELGKKANRESKIKSRYGLTLNEYTSYLRKPCGICGGKSEVLDHCHTTLCNREALCQSCNKLLGFAGDDIDVLNKAIEYLKKHTNA